MTLLHQCFYYLLLLWVTCALALCCFVPLVFFIFHLFCFFLCLSFSLTVRIIKSGLNIKTDRQEEDGEAENRASIYLIYFGKTNKNKQKTTETHDSVDLMTDGGK